MRSFLYQVLYQFKLGTLDLRRVFWSWIRRKQSKALRIYIVVLISSSFFCTTLISPAISANRIAFSYRFFGEFYVSIKDLEVFAKTEEVTPSFAYYADRVTEENLAELKDLLNRHFNINQLTASIFLDLPIGKELTQQISLIVNAPATVSQPALRAAVILAAAEPNGLTILNVLRFYSTKTLRLNTKKIVTAVDEATTILADTERVFQALSSQASIDAKAADSSNLNSFADLRRSGAKKWRQEYLFIKSERDRLIEGVVYLPENSGKPAPLVIIAPGLNTNWRNFTYIAEHLASYGFGVAAINFPGTNSQRVNAVLKGLDTPPSDNQWIEQPKIITRLLDEIEDKSQTNPIWQGKLNLQKVGIIGQSLGGYTAMAIAGAKVNWQHLEKECRSWQDSSRINLNPSLYWQCQSIAAPPPTTNLQDQRIVAAIAINPVTNPVFDRSGINQFDLPLMIVAGDKDLFAPALDEQIEPFTWLPEIAKYLVLVKNSTHFSFIGEETDEVKLPDQISGANLTLAHSYLKFLSVAFFQTYLAQDEYDSHLSESHLKSISQQPLPINILRSLNSDRLKELIDQ